MVTWQISHSIFFFSPQILITHTDLRLILVAEGTVCLIIIITMASGETVEHLLYSSFTDLAVCRTLSHILSHFFLIAALVQQFSTFLQYVIPEVCQHHHLVVLPAASVLKLTLSVCSTFSQKPPLQPLCYPNLASQIQYIMCCKRKSIAPALPASISRHQGQGYASPLSSGWVNRSDYHWKKLFRYRKSTSTYLLEC